MGMVDEQEAHIEAPSTHLYTMVDTSQERLPVDASIPLCEDDAENTLPNEDSSIAVAGSSSDGNPTDAEAGSGVSSGEDSVGRAGLRERTARHIGNIGRHFNILDRLFRRSSQQHNRLSYGANFDGVFSNLSAKPDANENLEDVIRQDNPPTYDDAAADMSPSYYGLTRDGSALYYDETCIEGLPVGSIANFVWNLVVTISFQFVGFLITYVLHTSHAAKQGSRFGLGFTFMRYAYAMVPNNVTSKVGKDKALSRIQPADPNNYDDLNLYSGTVKEDNFESKLSHGLEEEKQKLPVVALLIGILGLYIALKSIYDYIKIKKMEHKYLSQDQV